MDNQQRINGTILKFDIWNLEFSIYVGFYNFKKVS